MPVTSAPTPPSPRQHICLPSLRPCAEDHAGENRNARKLRGQGMATPVQISKPELSAALSLRQSPAVARPSNPRDDTVSLDCDPCSGFSWMAPSVRSRTPRAIGKKYKPGHRGTANPSGLRDLQPVHVACCAAWFEPGTYSRFAPGQVRQLLGVLLVATGPANHDPEPIAKPRSRIRGQLALMRIVGHAPS